MMLSHYFNGILCFSFGLAATPIGYSFISESDFRKPKVDSSDLSIEKAASKTTENLYVLEREDFARRLMDTLNQLIVENVQTKRFLEKITRKSDNIIEIRLTEDHKSHPFNEGYVSDVGEGDIWELLKSPSGSSLVYSLNNNKSKDISSESSNQAKNLYPDLSYFESEIGKSSLEYPSIKPPRIIRKKVKRPAPAIPTQGSEHTNFDSESNPRLPLPSPPKKTNGLHPNLYKLRKQLRDFVASKKTLKKNSGSSDPVAKRSFHQSLKNNHPSLMPQDDLQGSYKQVDPDSVKPERFDSDLLNVIFNKPQKLSGTNKPANKWSLLKALKTLFGTRAQVFTPSHEYDQRKKLARVREDIPSVEKHFSFYSIGSSAWTKTEEDEDIAGSFGGLDGHFITKSQNGSMVAFGVTDGPKLNKMFSDSEGISEKLCSIAEKSENIFEAQKSPLQLMRIAYDKAISDPSVFAGATSALFGTIVNERLEIARLGTPWVSVMRNGRIVHQMSMPSEPSDEKYPLIKMPYVKSRQGSQLSAAQRDKLFTISEQISWNLAKGDVVLVATNGLYKRMTSREIEKSVGISLRRGYDMSKIASTLVETAIGVLQVDLDETPFWVHSCEKSEDIMVLLIEFS